MATLVSERGVLVSRKNIGRPRGLVCLVLGVLLSLAGASLPAGATTPGRNGPVVFAADFGFGFQLYRINPNGTGLRQLTNLADAQHPDWSPSGRRIAFHLYQPKADDTDIAVMGANGGHLNVLHGRFFEEQPAFTPDGRHLVYECGNCPGGQGIFAMRANGTHRHRVTTNPFPDEADSDPNVSPDGQTITFVRHKVDGELQALFAVDRDGSNVRKLVSYRREVAIKHDWAPNGRHIVITINADYPNGRSPNVATVRADGSHLTRLTHIKGGVRGALAGSYSPNGRWIAFRIENQDKGLYTLFKIHPNGTCKTIIAHLPFAPRHIDWGSRRLS